MTTAIIQQFSQWKLTIAQNCTPSTMELLRYMAKHTIPPKPNSNLYLRNIKHILFLQCTLQIQYQMLMLLFSRTTKE